MAHSRVSASLLSSGARWFPIMMRLDFELHVLGLLSFMGKMTLHDMCVDGMAACLA